MRTPKDLTESDYDLDSYDYHLPEEQIAQVPVSRRDASRLLILNQQSNTMHHAHFPEIIKLLRPGDLLVINDTKVFPARLLGKKETGGKIELFLLHFPSEEQINHSERINSRYSSWSQARVTALIKSSKRPKIGTKCFFGKSLEGIVEEYLPEGKAQVLLHFNGSLKQIIETYGSVPLPPYIHRKNRAFPRDSERYQTLYAQSTGAVAAPTAGLHFSEDILGKINSKNIPIVSITLHVGYGTFAPVRTKDIRDHSIHAEYVIVPYETAQRINTTKRAGGRIWAVGTTTARALEFAVDEKVCLREMEGWCDLYIYPGYRFKVVNALLTNFHLPRSSLLFLVAAMIGRERLLEVYEQAIRLQYRFYSYGDAMVIIT